MSEVNLYLGDCLDVMKDFKDKSVDVIITDLPYGITKCSWDVIIPFETMWEQANRVCAGAFITTSCQPFTSKLIMSNLKEFRYELIWVKTYSTNFLNANKRPMRKHENILIFGKTQVYNPQMVIGKVHRRGSSNSIVSSQSDNYKSFLKGRKETESYLYYPVSTIEFGNESIGYFNHHSTQKSLSLYEYLVRTYTNENQTVLDITMGSGTTGVACVNTGRNFIGIEINPEFFEIAKNRIKKAQQQIKMEI